MIVHYIAIFSSNNNSLFLKLLPIQIIVLGGFTMINPKIMIIKIHINNIIYIYIYIYICIYIYIYIYIYTINNTKKLIQYYFDKMWIC